MFLLRETDGSMLEIARPAGEYEVSRLRFRQGLRGSLRHGSIRFSSNSERTREREVIALRLVAPSSPVQSRTVRIVSHPSVTTWSSFAVSPSPPPVRPSVLLLPLPLPFGRWIHRQVRDRTARSVVFSCSRDDSKKMCVVPMWLTRLES